MHDLAIGTGTHNDGMQSAGGHDIQIVHDTVLAKGAVSCLMFGGESGAPSHILIATTFWMKQLQTYFEPHGDDRTIVNNHFGRDAVLRRREMQGN